MKKIVGVLGTTVVALTLVTVSVVYFTGGFSKVIKDASETEEYETAENVDISVIALGETGHYPYFVSDYGTDEEYKGIHNICLDPEYISETTGANAYTKSDALLNIKAFEWIYDDSVCTNTAECQEKGYCVEDAAYTSIEISGEKIKVYPYDDENSALQEGRSSIDLTAGSKRYTLLYSVEAPTSGLKTECTTHVTVDCVDENEYPSLRKSED